MLFQKNKINIFIRPEDNNSLSQIFKIKIMTEKNVKADFGFKNFSFTEKFESLIC